MSDEREDTDLILSGPFANLPEKTKRLIESARQVSVNPAGNVALHDALATVAAYNALNTDTEAPEWIERMKVALRAQSDAITNKKVYSDLMRTSDPGGELQDAIIELQIVEADEEMVEHRRSLLGLDED